MCLPSLAKGQRKSVDNAKARDEKKKKEKEC